MEGSNENLSNRRSSHTCIELIQEGHEVVVIDNFCNSSRYAIDAFERITGSKLKCYEFDVRKKQLLERLFLSKK